jgi:hypothetical protein
VRPRAFEEQSGPISARLATGLAKVGLAMRHEDWHGAHAQGLSPTQAQILALLRAREPATLGDIAVELAVGAPTASEAVGSLVAKGLVRKDRPQPTREPSPSRSHARGTKRRRGRRDGPTSSERRWTSWMPSSKRRSCRG